MQQIPTVDLRDFLSDDPARKQKFVNEIGKAYEEIGFVALKGHFLDNQLVENLYTEVRNFFNLPLETKSKYEISGIGGQRGYVSFGKEHAKGRSAGDLKEFWHFGQYVSENSKWANEYPNNVEVSELPNFNKVGEEAYKMLEKTGKYVLRALALHIGLDEFYFDNFIKDGNSILRPIHYPPITDEPKDGAVRAAAHGDINLITLLMGAQGKGLQVQNHDGQWIDAMAQPDELMINVGFWRGYDVYDQTKVGFISDTPAAQRVGTKLETASKGGGNHGHEFGTALSAEEKDALVEYLKTL